MWECKICSRVSEDADITCWSCGGKKEDVELRVGERPLPLILKEIKISHLTPKKRKSPAFKFGIIFTLVGFGSWLIAIIILKTNVKELMMYSFRRMARGDEATALNFLAFVNDYGIFIGIGGVVLLVIGLSLRRK